MRRSRPRRSACSYAPKTSTQVAQMSEEDGQTGQANEYETDSDYDETEVDGTGLDSDELALIGVQSRKTS